MTTVLVQTQLCCVNVWGKKCRKCRCVVPKDNMICCDRIRNIICEKCVSIAVDCEEVNKRKYPKGKNIALALLHSSAGFFFLTAFAVRNITEMCPNYKGLLWRKICWHRSEERLYFLSKAWLLSLNYSVDREPLVMSHQNFISNAHCIDE